MHTANTGRIFHLDPVHLIFCTLVGLLPSVDSDFWDKMNHSPLEKISFLEENVSLMILLALAFSLIFHQIMSKNQIFIYFLIPIFFGYLDSTFNESKENSKKFISIFLVIFIFFIVILY